MGSTITSPLGPAVPTVPLPAAPILLVIAQVRFPLMTGVDAGGAFLASFQEAIRGDYEILRKEVELNVPIGQWPGPNQTNERIVWRFEDRNSAWRVRLYNDSAALSAPTYTNRADFISRLARLLESLNSHLRPGLCDRLGIRFVSRITDARLLDRLPELIEPYALGTMATPLGLEGAELQHVLTDMALRPDDQSALRARWGLLPANGTFDVTIAPVESRSFAIDIDISTTTQVEFSPLALLQQARTFCDHQYRFFRWLVQDQFLREFGGEP